VFFRLWWESTRELFKNINSVTDGSKKPKNFVQFLDMISTVNVPEVLENTFRKDPDACKRLHKAEAFRRICSTE
jgi:hypothetical protein